MSVDKKSVRRCFGQWWGLFCGRVPAQYKKDFQNQKIETNLFRTLVFSVFIICMQVFLNVLNMLIPNTSAGTDIMKFIYLSLFCLCVGVVCLIISLLIRRGHFKNRYFRHLFPYALIYLYCGIQLVFLAFNVESSTGMNPYIIALIILGFFLVMRPIQSLLSIMLLFTLALAILVTAGASSNALNTVLSTDTWANLLIITGLIAVMSYVFYKIYLDNFLARKQLETSNERLDKLAKTDELTGLLNRWGLFELADSAWEDFQNHPGVISVFMFDLDYFKEYNDSYGHLTGDECLRQTARSLETFFGVKESSIVCRFGGEEFLVIMYINSETEALTLAEAMQKDLYQRSRTLIEGVENAGVTISGGLVTARTNDPFVTLDDLIDRADKALYEAKETGRSKIVVADKL